MRITIAERLNPFSHEPGTYFLVPGSSLRVQVFPALLRLYDLSGKIREQIADIPLDIKGPVEGFTVQQDLEKGSIVVWGHAADGYFRYCLQAIPEAPRTLGMTVEKGVLKTPFLQNGSAFRPEEGERLSLGNHKAQDWVLMKRRCDMTEIFPLWFRLGQLCGGPPSIAWNPSLLATCAQLIEERDRCQILSAFRNLFLAGFDIGLSPRLTDIHHLGFSLPIMAPEDQSTPLQLLSEGAKLIRSLFIQQRGLEISILPVLPVEFHCGRMQNIDCGHSGRCAMEWSKKTIRRMSFSAKEDASLLFRFEPEIKQFRLRQKNQEQEILNGASIEVRGGETYFFDRFMK